MPQFLALGTHGYIALIAEFVSRFVKIMILLIFAQNKKHYNIFTIERINILSLKYHRVAKL